MSHPCACLLPDKLESARDTLPSLKKGLLADSLASGLASFRARGKDKQAISAPCEAEPSWSSYGWTCTEKVDEYRLEYH